MKSVLIFAIAFLSMVLKVQGQTLNPTIEEMKGDISEYLSFESWLINLKKKLDRAKGRDLEEIDKENESLSHEEVIARVISCVGDCRKYRGLGYNSLRHNSKIKETDDVTTDKDSYLWLFLMDGSLLRMAPKTSVTFKEINIGTHENFLHLRVNEGLVYFASREMAPIEETNRAQTDSIFLPLPLYEANKLGDKNKKLEENELDKFLLGDQSEIDHAKRLNRFKKLNNQFIQGKKTFTFFIFPNGTLTGKDLKVHLFSQLGGESFLKLEHGSEAKLHFRGYKNTEPQAIEKGNWLRISEDGRRKEEIDGKKEGLALASLLTKRITSVKMAREYFLKKYSQMLFGKTIDEFSLKKAKGYRLWGKLKSKENELKSDLEKRLEFLTTFTRRSETSLLFSALNLKKRLQRKGERDALLGFNNSYFDKALEHYLLSLSSKADGPLILDPQLQGVRKKLWLMQKSKSR